jgi:hypothetical protein
MPEVTKVFNKNIRTVAVQVWRSSIGLFFIVRSKAETVGPM